MKIPNFKTHDNGDVYMLCFGRFDFYISLNILPKTDKLTTAAIRIYNKYISTVNINFASCEFISEQFSEPLGMESGSIPNEAIKASSERDDQHSASRSRLNTKPEGEQMGAWVPLESDENQWLQVDLGKVAEITKVCTQGGGEGVEHRVNSYILSFSEDQENFQEYQENGEIKVNIHVAFVLC